MRHLTQLLAALVGALAVLVLAPGPAYACSCVAAGTAEHVDLADVVVIARVDSVRLPLALLSSSADPARYELVVEQALKGDVAARLTVLSAQSGASCGLEGVEEGGRYVVFADLAPSGALTASLCGGTQAATGPVVAETIRATGGTSGTVGALADDSTLALLHDHPLGSDLAGPLALLAAGSLVVLTGGLWLRLVRS
ncbi:MAG: hypothetical protein WBQ50_19810 [Nocardioides sp.]